MVIISDLEGPGRFTLRCVSDIKEFKPALHLELVLQPLAFNVCPSFCSSPPFSDVSASCFRPIVD